jgi:hypothetical protein
MPDRTNRGQFAKGHRIKPKPNSMPGASNPNWTGDDASLSAQRKRVIKVLGPAKQYQCEHCDSKPASDWAHIHGKSGNDIQEDFLALCRECHMRYDKEARIESERKLAAHRRTGAVLSDDTKQQISDSLKEHHASHPWSDERRAAAAERMRKRNQDPAFRARVSAATAKANRDRK